MTDANPAARKGLLKYLQKQGGTAPIGDLHAYSTLRYQAGHQAFSQLMEGLVDEGLVSWDGSSFSLTDQGRAAVGGMLL